MSAPNVTPRIRNFHADQDWVQCYVGEFECQEGPKNARIKEGKLIENRQPQNEHSSQQVEALAEAVAIESSNQETHIQRSAIAKSTTVQMYSTQTNPKT